ncbi:MAG: hypothetical protein CL912_17770 [Deltaproteobacteria bacterium]|nr:hypothetical protein [Deltaproteobacteria bacterium]
MNFLPAQVSSKKLQFSLFNSYNSSSGLCSRDEVEENFLRNGLFKTIIMKKLFNKEFRNA